jgi:hypothetical protein
MAALADQLGRLIGALHDTKLHEIQQFGISRGV